jgi:hypothetical protein
VASEVIENRLPALALLLDRMGRFAVKCNAHIDTGLDRGEFDPGLSITKGILDQLRLDDLRVRSSKIEAHAAVLSLHAGGKFATLSQIDGGSGRVPSVGRCIPLFNVMRRRIGPPDLTNGPVTFVSTVIFTIIFPFCFVVQQAADQPPGMGKTGITSTASPGKIVKCGWFSKSFAAASFDSARTTVKAPISLLMSSIPR